METQALMDKLLEILIQLYRQEITTSGTNSSGTLYNSIRSQINENNEYVEGSLILQDYWKYVESGRSPGKFPNINKIKDWIKQKPIIPNSYSGKLPTTDQLSFLIARSIATKGIKGKNLLQKALEILDREYTQIINQSINNQINTQLNEVIH